MVGRGWSTMRHAGKKKPRREAGARWGGWLVGLVLGAVWVAIGAFYGGVTTCAVVRRSFHVGCYCIAFPAVALFLDRGAGYQLELALCASVAKYFAIIHQKHKGIGSGQA
jgi:hypothetical protein